MSAEDKLDVIVVGAGLAGLACAHEAVVGGLSVAVLERGDAPGSKNLSGGQLYLQPVRRLCAGLLENSPFERMVVSESIVLTEVNSSLSFRHDCKDTGEHPNSAVVLMSHFLKNLAKKVTEKGALVLTQQKVDGLIQEEGCVVGVKVGSDDLRADTIVAADGALSFLAQEAGLMADRSVNHYGIGVKEIIQLEASRIEDRFNLPPGGGASMHFVGQVTQGLPGAGFIYTNSDSLSVGIVVHMKSFSSWDSGTRIWEFLDTFKKRKEVSRLLNGGKIIEYGAHLIPEISFGRLPSSGMPGLLLVGDAAGFVLNTGINLRGMDLAMASGTLAGRAIVECREEDRRPESSLNRYRKRLQKSFIFEEMKSYRNAVRILTTPRLYERTLPGLVGLTEMMFRIDGTGQTRSIWKILRKFGKKRLGWSGFRDLWRFIRMGK